MLTLTYVHNITSPTVFQSLDDVTPTNPNMGDVWNMESIGAINKPETIKTDFKKPLSFKDGMYQGK